VADDLLVPTDDSHPQSRLTEKLLANPWFPARQSVSTHAELST
jgi:hypothetical protein